MSIGDHIEKAGYDRALEAVLEIISERASCGCDDGYSIRDGVLELLGRFEEYRSHKIVVYPTRVTITEGRRYVTSFEIEPDEDGLTLGRDFLDRLASARGIIDAAYSDNDIVDRALRDGAGMLTEADVKALREL